MHGLGVMSVARSGIVSSGQKFDLNSLCTQNGTNMEHHANMGLLRIWARVRARRVPPCVCMLLLVYGAIGSKTKKSRQHPDFPGGHPPEYYPSLRLLNFAERTGYGVLSLRWPSTNGCVA